MIRLNIAAKSPIEGVSIDGRSVHLLPLAYQSQLFEDKKRPKYREVGQLENRRQQILEGVQEGARRVLEVFLPAMLKSSDQEATEQMIETAMDMIFHGSKTSADALSEDTIDGITSSLKGRLIIE